MKKYILVLALLTASARSAFAYAGTFGLGIELTGTGVGATNNGTTTFYDLDQGGGSDPNDEPPTGTTATVSTAWSNSSTGTMPTFNLGTFVIGDTLILNGGSLLTYQGSSGGTTDTVTSATLNYSVAVGAGMGTFPNINLPDEDNGAGGVAGNIRWATESDTINLLTGLAPGVYELDVYGAGVTSSVTDGETTVGGVGETNGGANYGAIFTVVPEPGTVSLVLLGLGGLVWSRKRFGKSAGAGLAAI